MDHAHLAALFGGIALVAAACFGFGLQRRRSLYRSRPYTCVGPPRCEAHGLNYEHYLDPETDRRICHPPNCAACPRSLRQRAEHVTGTPPEHDYSDMDAAITDPAYDVPTPADQPASEASSAPLPWRDEGGIY